MTWTLLIAVLRVLELLPSQLYDFNQLPTDSNQAKILKHPNLGVSGGKIGIVFNQSHVQKIKLLWLPQACNGLEFHFCTRGRRGRN